MVPAEAREGYLQRYKKDGRTIHLPQFAELSDFDLVAKFGAQLRGITQYYALAQNVGSLHSVSSVMRYSLLKTLANKHRSTARAMHRKYSGKNDTPNGLRACIEVVIQREGKKPLRATCGGLSLTCQKKVVLVDDKSVYHFRQSRNSLEKRLLANACEVCGSDENVEVHHIRKLKDINKPGRREKPWWTKVMIAHRRKTLVLCRKHHVDLHAGRPVMLSSDVVAS
jgi:hypothetical protein